MKLSPIGAIVARLWLAGVATVGWLGGEPPDEPNQSPEHAYARQRLEARAEQQRQQARHVATFHRFRFTDRTDASGLTFRHRIVADAGINYRAAHYDHGNGLALADVDQDGLTDCYFTTQIGSNQLWRNQGQGRFEDLTVQAGVGLADLISVSAAFGDIDNDGDPDLFVTTVRQGNVLFENLGQGKFRDITRSAGVAYEGHSSGAVFLDYDRDGRLDLCVANVGRYTNDERGPGGFYRALPDAFSGHLYPERAERSLLYRNLGDNRFQESAEKVGFRDRGWNGDVTFTDLNADGFPELYLVNMQGDDSYYENRQGTRFIARTADRFPRTSWGAMGAKFFDYDRDGNLDLFVTDMHSDMTQGQTTEALRFDLRKEKTKSEAYCSIQWTEAYLQGSGNNLFGNAFYRNSGEGTFEEVSDRINAETYWPWGFSVGDLNADGWEDVFVTAGMGYPFRYGINSLLLNDGGERFFDAEFLVGIEPRQDGRTEKVWFTLDCDGEHRNHPECRGAQGRKTVLGTLSSRASAIADLDRDGDLDLIVDTFNDRPQLFFSDLSEKRRLRFLELRLVGTASNRDGLGALVRVRAGERQSIKYHDGKSGYLSQSSLPLYFGLEDFSPERSLEVEVRWPSGRRSVKTLEAAFRGRLTLTEDDD